MRIPRLFDAPHEPRNASPAAQQGGHVWWRRGSGGGGGGGGARGGGSVSSGGSRGNSGSSSSSGGVKGAASGGRISGGSPGVSQPKTVTSGQLPAAQRGSVYGSRGSYGYGRPYQGGVAPIYGFWPLTWSTNAPEGSAANNASRPGGPLLAAGLQAPTHAEVTYVVYGDTQSVDAVFGVLGQNCSAVNATVPADLSGNVTLEQYRDDSFALYRFAAPGVATNQSLEACLNATIGDNLLVAAAGQRAVPVLAACLVAAVVGLRI